MKGDHKVNWKMLADRTGMPISKLRAAMKGLSGRPREALLKALAIPTDGRDSRYYAHQHSYSHTYENVEHQHDISTEEASSAWEALENTWNSNIWKTKRWREERAQVFDPYDEKVMVIYNEDTANE